MTSSRALNARPPQRVGKRVRLPWAHSRASEPFPSLPASWHRSATLSGRPAPRPALCVARRASFGRAPFALRRNRWLWCCVRQLRVCASGGRPECSWTAGLSRGAQPLSLTARSRSLRSTLDRGGRLRTSSHFSWRNSLAFDCARARSTSDRCGTIRISNQCLRRNSLSLSKGARPTAAFDAVICS